MRGRTQVAFQGERGAYSEAAAIDFFGPGIEPVPCASFEDVFQGVEKGSFEYGIVPIENSLAGSIHQNYDLLLRHQLAIVGEMNLRIVHNLIAHRGVKLADIKRIYSHPQALSQCERYLDGLSGVERMVAYDTAGSVKMIKDQGLKDAAAIASRQAAIVYDMAILEEGIEDEAENFTRFLVLSRQVEIPEDADKTSVVFSVENVPGSLFKSLSVFALREIDLTKIESRPLRGKPWEYIFYLDFIGSASEERCKNALNHLREIATLLRLLGSYPRAKNKLGNREG